MFLAAFAQPSRLDATLDSCLSCSTAGTWMPRRAATSAASTYRANMKIHDPRMLDVVHEPWWGLPTVCMTTIFPNVIFQQQVNSLSTRQIVPQGPDQFDFIWTHFGFEEDTSEMSARRLQQANLFGPAGLVSADDGEVIEYSQDGLRQDEAFATLCELGGTAVENTNLKLPSADCIL